MRQPTVTDYRPPEKIIGDGTTGKSRLKQRWKRWRMLIFVIASVLVVGFITTLIRPSGNTIPLHPQNAEGNGAMALTQILQNNGVHLTVTGSAAQALSLADSNTTVFVYDTPVLGSNFFRDVYDHGSDLVIVEPALATINEFNLGVQLEYPGQQDLSGQVEAQCAAAAAQSAREIIPQQKGFSLRADSSAELCFTRNEIGAYAQSADERIHLFATTNLLQNNMLARAGHAALTIGALGKHENLVWLIPAALQDGQGRDDGGSLLVFLPPWFPTALIHVAFTAAALAFWRGRRMGRLVSEPLPVVVRGAETTLGLGQIYRRSNEIDHAAAALRAGTASRCAKRLGISPSASSRGLASAIANATNRPYDDIERILLGPPPRTNADLITLAQMLEHLESEVHSS